MKSRILKIIPIIFILLAILSVNVYAVTYSSTDRTVDSEGDISITVKASENVQNYDISLTSYTGLTYVSCSANENAAVNSTTGAVSYATLGSGTTTLATYKFKAPKVTKDTTYNVVFNINGTSNTAKITVKAKPPVEEKTEEEKPTNTETPGTTTTTPNTSTTQKPETTTKPETPVVTEPKFTDVNKTMYSTGEINLRASWSTSSAATLIDKGTELKITGTSSEKVNGYVWYRVNYNGTTKYVASYLLTSTKPEEEKKSDNAYLKSLIVEGYELLPVFDKNTTSYTLQVPSDVTELNVKVETEDEKAKTEIQGNKDLKEGENTVTISVNAEDNTIKIYEITVTKSEKIALGLKTLKIKNTDITKKFKPELYNYEIDIEDVTKLDIEAIANDETATVEILGNEDLQEGENTITIIVSSQDGKEKVTYQIKANKVIEKVATTVKEEKKEIDPKIYLYVGIGTVVLIALIIVVVYTIKHRNEDEYEFTDNFGELPDGFPGELPERNEETQFYNNYDLNKTQELNIPNEEQSQEDVDFEDRKAKIDYFLDNTDDDTPRRRRGKHF